MKTLINYKTLILLLVTTALNFQSFAQQQDEYRSLFNPVSIRGGIAINAGVIGMQNDEMMLRTGASIAVILNKSLAIGFTGTGFAGSQNVILDGDKHSTVGGFGGLLIEPILLPNSPIHFSLPIALGVGQVQYFKDQYGYPYWDEIYYSSVENDFLFIEPGVNAEMNLTSFMRFGVGASYVFTNTLNAEPVIPTELDGLSMTASLKFGWFK
ncbi:MAG: hypothetical protein JXR19_07560 [Bacteroidia bacterium]